MPVIITSSSSSSNSTAPKIPEFWNWKVSSSLYGKTHMMIDTIVSGICVLSFLVFLIWSCCTGAKNKNLGKVFSKMLPGSQFLMVVYFGLQFANDILLQVGQLKVIQYYPSLIALDFISLFADSMLLSFLLVSFAERIYNLTGKYKNSIVFYQTYCWIVHAIAVANVPAFFYHGLQAISGKETREALAKAKGVRFKVMASYTALNVSFYGVYLGGVLILSWITLSHIRNLRRRQIPHGSWTTMVFILVLALLTRTVGKFIYAILFVLQARTKSPLMTLIHTIFYGLLSVLIFGSIMVMSRIDTFRHGVVTMTSDIRYHPASQNPYDYNEYKYPSASVHSRERHWDYGQSR